MSDFDNISSMGPNLSEGSSDSSSAAGEGGGGNWGQNVLGNMFEEQNPNIKDLMDKLTTGSHIVEMLPFGLGKVFKAGGLFKDAPMQSLLSFIDLSSSAIQFNATKSAVASIFQGKSGGRGR